MTHPALADAKQSDLVIVGRSGTLEIDEALLNLSVTRTVDGASTLNVSLIDPDRKLINSDVIKGYSQGQLHATCAFGGLRFRLVRVSVPAARRLNLQFEEQAVWKLRQFDNPKHVSRSKFTRAQFVKSLCDEAGVPYFIADLDKVQEIKKATDRPTLAQKRAKRHPGIALHGSITIKGSAADSEQRDNIGRVLDVARSVKAGPRATKALIVAAIGESDFRIGAVTGGQRGVFQSDQIAPTDLEAQAHAFLTGGHSFAAAGAIGLAKQHHGWTAGDIATNTEISGQPGGFYDVYGPEADKIIDAYTGGGSGVLTGSASASGSYAKTFYFQRGQDGVREDSWTAIKRLAVEVNWYAFCEDGTIYFLSREYLLASEPRMLVAVDAPGIESALTFNFDTSRKASNTIAVQARVGEWDAPPGSVVEVQGEGPLDGRDWIVGEITRSKWSSTLCDITVERIKAHRDEPAHETATRAADTLDLAAGEKGKVTIAAGANRTGQPIHPAVMQFLELVAGLTSEPIIVTTGSNHNQFVAGEPGVQSDHWTGDAADIGVGGDARTDGAAGRRGDNIATAALKVAGVEPVRARELATGAKLDFGTASNYSWHGHRVQIGWRTEVGGNHFNHVHIGVR